MQQISQMVKGIISCYLILNILIQAVPGEKYQKYVRAFGGFLMTVTLLGQLPVLEKLVSQEAFSELVSQYAKNFEDASGQTEQLGNLAYSGMISTMEEELRARIDKSGKLSGLHVRAVRVTVCEDTSDVNYGKIEKILLYAEEDTEKSVNISVDRIEIGQMDGEKKKEREIVLENVVAEELGVEPEMVSVHLE